MTKLDAFREACIRSGEPVDQVERTIEQMKLVIALPGQTTELPAGTEEAQVQRFLDLITAVKSNPDVKALAIEEGMRLAKRGQQGN